jgi:hypothetical protein
MGEKILATENTMIEDDVTVRIHAQIDGKPLAGHFYL